jgi:hypothetical protein
MDEKRRMTCKGRKTTLSTLGHAKKWKGMFFSFSLGWTISSGSETQYKKDGRDMARQKETGKLEDEKRKENGWAIKYSFLNDARMDGYLLPLSFSLRCSPWRED